MADIFFDDFSSYDVGVQPSGYTQTGGVDPWVTADVGGSGPSYRLLECPGTGTTQQYQIIRDDLSLTDLRFIVKINFQEASADWAGIIIGASSPSTLGQKYYFIEGSTYYNRWQIKDNAGENPVHDDFAIDDSIDYWLRVTVVGDKLYVEISLDGNNYAQLPNLTGWTLRNGYDGGYIGLVCRGANPPKTYFDDLRVPHPDEYSYGVKITKPGYDIASVTDKQCVFTSKHGSMKVRMSGSKACTGGSWEEVTHNFGYHPNYFCFLDDTDDEGNAGLFPMGLLDVVIDIGLYLNTYTTTTKLYLRSKNTKTVYYYLFAEKGAV